MEREYIVIGMNKIEYSFKDRVSAEKFASTLEKTTHNNYEVVKVLKRD